jgi:hypothetical protein
MSTFDSTQLARELELIRAAVVTGHDENAVREEVLLPLLKLLGYSRGDKAASIDPSAPLRRVMVGSKTVKLTSYPDYVVSVDGRPAFVVEAKRPGRVLRDSHTQQAEYYALHPKVAAPLCVVCNGDLLAVYRVGPPSTAGTAPIVSIARQDLASRWQDLHNVLAPGHLRGAALQRFESEARATFAPLGELAAIRRTVAGTMYELRPRPGEVLRTEILAKTNEASSRIVEGLRMRGPIYLPPNEFDFRVNGIDMQAHFGAIGELRLEPQPLPPVNLLMFAGPRLRPCRVTAPVRFVGENVEIGDRQRGFFLLIEPTRAQFSLEVVGDVRDALPAATFLSGFAEGPDVLIIDADTEKVIVAAKLPDGALPDLPAPVLSFLQACFYVSIRCGVPFTNVENAGDADVLAAHALASLLRGETIPIDTSFNVSAADAPKIVAGAAVDFERWPFALLGEEFVLEHASARVEAELRRRDVAPGMVRLSGPAQLVPSRPPRHVGRVQQQPAPDSV